VDPPDGLDESWTHGFLLVGHGDWQPLSDGDLAEVYREATLRLIDAAIDSGELWRSSFPALYMCRHTLELYLKSIVPDWRNLSKPSKGAKPNGHDIGILAATLRDLLNSRYPADQVEALCSFLEDFDRLDPKAMAFRFADGARNSFEKSKHHQTPPVEIWVDFRNLRTTIVAVFDALEKLPSANLVGRP
jgi:hypothetical protein